MTIAAREVQFALNLLRALHANVNNMYLLLAVVAWVRSESGTSYIGNNPLNLRPGSDDARYRSGVRLSRNGNGYFSVYANLIDAAKASANRLRTVGSWAGYGLIIKAAQRGTLDTNASRQEQAIDFLNAIALSKWDAGHYGTGKNGENLANNRLIRVWASLTGQKFSIPADPVAPPRKPRRVNPMPKRPPHPLVHMVPERDYLKPYASEQFYEARHTRVKPLSNPDPEEGGY